LGRIQNQKKGHFNTSTDVSTLTSNDGNNVMTK